MAFKKGGKGKGGIFRVLLVLLLLAVTLGAAFVLLILRPYENQSSPPNRTAQSKAKAARPANLKGPEAPGKKETAVEKTSPPARLERGDRELPLLAIVIDDMGYQQQIDEELLHLNLNLSFAFLPYGPHTPGQVELAKRLGREVILHLPMEPTDRHWNPGPGALTLAMSSAERAKVFALDLARVAPAVGINNHMGSRFTSDQAAMQDFLALARDRGLFFLDSLTSQDSLGYSLAREMGVKACRRQVFLDNVRNQARIIGQIRELLVAAERQGWAVGIGHPYPETLAALRAAGPEIMGRVQLVGVSRLAH